MTERAALTRVSFFAAPLLLIAYGSVRLFVPGSKAPGFGWTLGHFAFLFGVMFFGVACVGLWRMAVAGGGAVRRRIGAVGLVAGLIGVGAAFAQAVIDLVVGFHAVDKAEMKELFAQVQEYPGVMPVVYTVGPVFLYIGLIALLATLTGRHAVRALVLVLLGTVAMAASLDLMPIGGLCYLLALAPLGGRSVAIGSSTV
ncbi:hypothetical protein [Streptomyces sp. NPDC046712]|uniref:hypothetical protein n=1 Tax=Streptomyces sp. NPDC046712 TaxID=3154802 RepID=UPI00340A995E